MVSGKGGFYLPNCLVFTLINDILETISSMSEGCSLNYCKNNILCYADDMILLAPSSAGLQTMLNKLHFLLSELGLSVNAGKSQYIVFKTRNCKHVFQSEIKINGTIIEKVRRCKYLGVVLEEDCDLGPEVDRVTNSFLKQFNSVYQKFYFVDREVLIHLFKSFTSSFYGIEVWFEKLRVYQLNKISVVYHKAIKRICNLNVWDSNHLACEIAGVAIFKHMLAKKLVCFWHNIFRSKSPCLIDFSYYLRYDSLIFKKISELFTVSYGVDIGKNPLCAILSRVDFVQRNEPRSHYAQSLVQ